MFTHGLENESYKCFACISWAKRTDGWHMWNGCNMIMKLQCVKLRLAISHIATEPVLMLNDTAECDLMEGFWTHQNVYCVFCVPFSPFKQRGAVHVQRWRLCELAESFGIRENKIWRTKKKKINEYEERADWCKCALGDKRQRFQQRISTMDRSHSKSIFIEAQITLYWVARMFVVLYCKRSVIYIINIIHITYTLFTLHFILEDILRLPRAFVCVCAFRWRAQHSSDNKMGKPKQTLLSRHHFEMCNVDVEYIVCVHMECFFDNISGVQLHPIQFSVSVQPDWSVVSIHPLFGSYEFFLFFLLFFLSARALQNSLIQRWCR